MHVCAGNEVLQLDEFDFGVHPRLNVLDTTGASTGGGARGRETNVNPRTINV